MAYSNNNSSGKRSGVLLFFRRHIVLSAVIIALLGSTVLAAVLLPMKLGQKGNVENSEINYSATGNSATWEAIPDSPEDNPGSAKSDDGSSGSSQLASADKSEDSSSGKTNGSVGSGQAGGQNSQGSDDGTGNAGTWASEVLDLTGSSSSAASASTAATTQVAAITADSGSGSGGNSSGGSTESKDDPGPGTDPSWPYSYLPDYGTVTPADLSAHNYDDSVRKSQGISAHINSEDTNYTAGTRVKKKSVLLFYLCGTNLESNKASEGSIGAAGYDLAQMITSHYNPENLEILVMAGGTTKWSPSIQTVCKDKGFDNNGVNNVMYRLVPDKDFSGNLTSERAPSEININTLIPLFQADKDSLDISTPECLAGSVNWMYDNYDADHYSVIMWNHGGGVNKGVCVNDDNGPQHSISTRQLCQGYRSSRLYQGGKKLDFIGMDACMMGSLDLSVALSPYTKYYIASEEIEEGGWSYAFLKKFSESPESPLDAYKQIVDDFQKIKTDVTDLEQLMAVCDTSKAYNALTAYEQAMTALMSYINVNGDSLSYAKIHSVRAFLDDYGSLAESETKNYDLVDAGQFLVGLIKAGICTSETDAALKAVKELAIYSKSTRKEDGDANMAGISVFIPFKQIALQGYTDWMILPKHTEFVKWFKDNLTEGDLIELSSAITDTTYDKGNNTLTSTIDTSKFESFKSSLSSIHCGILRSGRGRDNEARDVLISAPTLDTPLGNIVPYKLNYALIDMGGYDEYKIEGLNVLPTIKTYTNSYEYVIRGLLTNKGTDEVENVQLTYITWFSSGNPDTATCSKIEFLDNNYNVKSTLEPGDDGWNNFNFDEKYMISYYQSTLQEYDTGVYFVQEGDPSEEMRFSVNAPLTKINHEYSMADAQDCGLVFLFRNSNMEKENRWYWSTPLEDDCKVDSSKYGTTLPGNTLSLSEMLAAGYGETLVTDDDGEAVSPMSVKLTFSNDYYLYNFLTREDKLRASARYQIYCYNCDPTNITTIPRITENLDNIGINPLASGVDFTDNSLVVSMNSDYSQTLPELEYSYNDGDEKSTGSFLIPITSSIETTIPLNFRSYDYLKEEYSDVCTADMVINNYSITKFEMGEKEYDSSKEIASFIGDVNAASSASVEAGNDPICSLMIEASIGDTAYPIACPYDPYYDGLPIYINNIPINNDKRIGFMIYLSGDSTASVMKYSEYDIYSILERADVNVPDTLSFLSLPGDEESAMEASSGGSTEDALEASTEGASEASSEGASEGSSESSSDGSSGAASGSSSGSSAGSSIASSDGASSGEASSASSAGSSECASGSDTGGTQEYSGTSASSPSQSSGAGTSENSSAGSDISSPAA